MLRLLFLWCYVVLLLLVNYVIVFRVLGTNFIGFSERQLKSSVIAKIFSLILLL